jgi:hypothetical protein
MILTDAGKNAMQFSVMLKELEHYRAKEQAANREADRIRRRRIATLAVVSTDMPVKLVPEPYLQDTPFQVVLRRHLTLCEAAK